MNWIDEVSLKLKKKNQVLFSKDSKYMQDLIMVFETQSHRGMALWAFDFASESIAGLEEKYPEEKRPREALEATKDWASGKIKMRLAQRKILVCHAFAKEIENCKDAVEQRKQEYIEKIIYWNEHLCDYQGTWADFMLK